MKAARLLVLGIALAAGGTAAWLAGLRPSAPPAASPPAATLDTVEILVATKDIAIGQRISAQDLEWRPWPTTSADSEVVRKTERVGAIGQLTGYMARERIARGDPVRESKLFDAKGSGYLAAILPAGMLGYTVEFSVDTSAGANVLPNDRVDVIMLHRNPNSPHLGGETFEQGETILRNVRVLAIDQRTSNSGSTPDSSSDSSKDSSKKETWFIGKSATLEVTSRQAETLAIARHQGVLSLALRSLLDSPSNRPATARVADPMLASRVSIVRFGQTTAVVCTGCDSKESTFDSVAVARDQVIQ
jgi:pilus assembly protein CpaB